MTNWLFALCAVLTLGARAAGAPRSNILLLLLDDVGYGDIDYGDGSHQSPARTPHISEFARGPHSVHFQRFYSGAPVCAPTRSSMLSGRSPTRDCVIHVEQTSFPARMNRSTAAAYAKSAGYATGFFGKWHLGSLTDATSPDCQPAQKGKCLPGYVAEGALCCDGRDAHIPVLRPTDVGYDVALATPQVAATATANCGCVGTVPGAGNNCSLGHYHGAGHHPASQPWLQCNQYFTSAPGTRNMTSYPAVTPDNDAEFLVNNFFAFAAKAVAAGQPFYAQISFHQNHIPYVAPQAYRNRYLNFDMNHQDYYGGLSVIDDQVGIIRARLQALGIANNTFLALTSDNGPEDSLADHDCIKFPAPGDTGGLQGRKRTLSEGGIRVTGIVEYPPLVKENRVDRGAYPAVTHDFLPTLVDITGARPPTAWPVDGVSLLPYLAGAATTRPTALGWFSDYPWLIRPPEGSVFYTCAHRPASALPGTMPPDYRTPFDQPQLAWAEGPLKMFACSLTPAVAASWRFALYDVVADDRETHDLWPGTAPAARDAMFARFLAWQASVEHSIATEGQCTVPARRTPAPASD